MPITFQCSCGKDYSVPDDYSGKTIRCNQCQKPVNVPAMTSGQKTNNQQAPSEPVAVSSNDEPAPKKLVPSIYCSDLAEDSGKSKKNDYAKSCLVFAIIVLIGNIALFATGGYFGYTVPSLRIGVYFLIPFVLTAAGIISGHIALHKIKKSGNKLPGIKLAKAGLIISYINVVLLLVVLFSGWYFTKKEIFSAILEQANR